MKFAQAIVLGAAMVLCSCASAEYKTLQDEESIHRPHNCSGLHVRNATWEFVDQYNQQVNVTGKCVEGMRHGNFNFYIDGVQVAVTKYVRDEEKFTRCYVGGQSYKILSDCIESHFNAKKAKAVEQSKNEE